MNLCNTEVCRLCLCEYGEFRDIFNDNLVEELPKKIAACFQTEVVLGDGYPSLICLTCRANIENIWIFRQKIKQSEEILKSNIINVLPYDAKDAVCYNTQNRKTSKNKQYSPVHLEDIFSDEQDSSDDDNISEFSFKSEANDTSQSSLEEDVADEEDLDVKLEYDEDVSDDNYHSVKSKRKKKESNSDTSNQQCYECGKVFKSAGYLEHHMRVHNGLKPYTCKICDKTFSQNSALIVHSRRHTGTRPYICTICGKGFIQSGNLAVHNRSHTGEKPYQCDVCSKTFSQVGNLYIHKRIHSGVREHVCKICKKAFKFPSHLAEHVKIHSEDKQHHCSICNKGFHKGSYLITHMRIHTGEKPYKCEHCAKSFSNSSNLAAHIRIHTGDKPYICHYCNKGFAQSSAMVRHVKQHKVQKAKQNMELFQPSVEQLDNIDDSMLLTNNVVLRQPKDLQEERFQQVDNSQMMIQNIRPLGTNVYKPITIELQETNMIPVEPHKQFGIELRNDRPILNQIQSSDLYGMGPIQVNMTTIPHTFFSTYR